MVNRYFYPSPVGLLLLEEENGAITKLQLREAAGEVPVPGNAQRERLAKYNQDLRETKLLQSAWQQLQEYFHGERREFDLPLCLKGTEFRRRVWAALRTIPYGEVRSYGQMAAMIGNPNASRAVGGANHHNPIMIIVPCHRVVGADGSLTGFGGGLPVKRYLLELEGIKSTNVLKTEELHEIYCRRGG